MIFYEEILSVFHKQKVKYILVGGIAVNLLGSMRSTADLDILVEMSSENLLKIVEILMNQGYQVKQPVDPKQLADTNVRTDWIQNRNMKAFNFYKEKEFKEVDIIIDSPVSYSTAIQDPVYIKINDLRIPVISIHNLIEMKKVSDRSIDKIDIEALEEIQELRKSL